MPEVLVSSEIYDCLQHAMASNPEGFRELYRHYLSDAQETMGALQTAYQSRSGDEFRYKAHYLKSSSLVLGIKSVAQCCAELEELSRSVEFNAAGEKLSELLELLAHVQAELIERLGPEVLPVAA